MERPPSIPPSPKSVSSKSGRSTLPQVQVHMHKLDPEIVDNEPIVLEREEKGSSRYPVATVIFFATTGFVSGYFLSVWNPGSEGQATKEALVMWIGLIGDLFLRALKCVVLPLVFINVVLSTVDMLKLGKAGKVVSYTVGFYMFTTLVAALVGVFTVICYKGFFIDVSSDIGVAEESGLEQVSLSDTIYDGVFIKLISTNIFADFVNSNFASIIFFAVVFAFAVQKATTHLHLTNQTTASHVVDLFRELEQVLLEMINWILTITPIAVFSLVANAVGKQDDPATAFANVGFLLAATATGFAIHFLLVYCLLILVVTKSNPFSYYKHLVPAQLMAFASASSAATIPVTLKSAIASGQVAPFIGGFVIPLGATLNMDGGGIYFPLATIFLAVTSGLEDQITVASYVMLVIIATIGSAGTAPVPSASLVLIITAYNTIFNTTGTPETFSFILAIDWLLDRGRTILNITGDATVARIVSHLMASEEDADDDSAEAEVKRTSAARFSRLTNPEGASMRKSKFRGGQGGPSSGGEML